MEYEPAGQILTDVTIEVPASHLYPAGHGPEHVAFDNPDVSPYVPAGQFVHAIAPRREYVPG